MDMILCKVCYRPTRELICSRRCQGLLKIKERLMTDVVRQRIMTELNQLPKGASICPGRLSKLVLTDLGIAIQEERDALSLLRETLFAMRDAGVLRFFQKNVLVPKAKSSWDLRGPFRVKGKS